MNVNKPLTLQNEAEHMFSNKIKSMDQNQTESALIRQPQSSLSLNNAHILGIGISNPPIANYTTEIFENIKTEYVRLGISDSDLEKLTRFYENCGIEKRYSYTDFSKTTLTENLQGEYFNEKYKRIVPELAFQSASKAINDWRGDVKSITGSWLFIDSKIRIK
jgi:hypothetical protein